MTSRILIIDDDQMVRETLCDILIAAGFDATSAEDGEAGVNAHRRTPFDLIITDILMPGKEGIETIIDLRRDDPDSKVVAISGGSGFGTGSYLPMAEKLGAAATLQKPFTSAALIATVNQLLAPPTPAAAY